MNAAQAERAAKRVAHIKSHLDYESGRDLAIRNIENNLGDPRACLDPLLTTVTVCVGAGQLQLRRLRCS
jgi:hypothetical protein